MLREMLAAPLRYYRRVDDRAASLVRIQYEKGQPTELAIAANLIPCCHCHEVQ